MPITPIHLDRSDPEPLYRQIEGQLRAAIEDGRLRPGASLPGIRSLARALNVAPNTVVLAYEQLAAEGYVIGHVGSGTQVTEELPETYLHARPVRRPVGVMVDTRARPRLPRPNEWAPSFGAPGGDGPVTSFEIEFRPIEEDRDSIPSETWGRLLQGAFRELTDARPTSGGKGADPRGDPRLREALAAYLGAARAVRCTADEVIITAGARAACAIASRIFTAPGRVSATEDPGDPGMAAALAIAGGRVVRVPVDRDGIRVDRLPAEAVLVHVTPSWQFPGGGTMPMRRRESLLAWAHDTGSLIVEDDREGELRYEGPSLPSLQGLDRDGRVIYVNGSRRYMLPGLDVSYAVVPPGLVDRFLGMIDADGQSPGHLSQRAFARFIDEGHFERYLRRMRLALSERQTVLAEGIEREVGWLLRADPAPAGSHLLATVLDPLWTASAVADVARAVGFSMTPIRSLRSEQSGPDRELLVPYAARSAEQIRAGLRRLARALQGSERGSEGGDAVEGGAGAKGQLRETADSSGATATSAMPPATASRAAPNAATSSFAALPEPRLYRVSDRDPVRAESRPHQGPGSVAGR